MSRNRFLAVLGFCLVVTATSLGLTASRAISLRTYTPPSAEAARGSGPAAKADPAVPPERWTNIFAPSQGMQVPSRLAGKTAQAASDRPATVYVLLGTISSDSQSARRAILWTEGLKEPRIVREHGELEPGVRLAAIERDHVWLSRGRTRERLDLLPVGSRTRQVARPASPASSAAPPATPGGAAAPGPATAAAPGGGDIRVSRIGENTFSLDEGSVDQLTTNINQYMTQVRVIPYFEGSASAGYRIAAIRPGTTFEQLGFKGGDIIQQINNVDLTSPEKMYTIFQNLKDQKRVTVNILRQGAKSTLTYEIR